MYVIITHQLLSGRHAQVFYSGSDKPGSAEKAHAIHYPRLTIVSVEHVTQTEFDRRNDARIAAELAR